MNLPFIELKKKVNKTEEVEVEIEIEKTEIQKLQNIL